MGGGALDAFWTVQQQTNSGQVHTDSGRTPVPLTVRWKEKKKGGETLKFKEFTLGVYLS